MIDKVKKRPIGLDLDSMVKENFKKVTLRSLVVPVSLLFLFFFYFAFILEGSFVDTYVASQKNIFLTLNKLLSVYPHLADNITQLGDALVIFPFFFIFLVIAPKFWEVLITSSILTLVISAVLKSIFAVPRPAAMIDMDTFVIMGIPNILHTSLPSGHSMTAFMVIIALLYAFMPKKPSHKVFWSLVLVTIGLAIGFSRVAVGAHYPFDVILGCTIGYITVISSININRNLNWLYWMKTKKFYPVVMFILSIWAYLLVLKTIKYNMAVFYISLTALVVTFVIITNKYVKKNKA